MVLSFKSRKSKAERRGMFGVGKRDGNLAGKICWSYWLYGHWDGVLTAVWFSRFAVYTFVSMVSKYVRRGSRLEGFSQCT